MAKEPSRDLPFDLYIDAATEWNKAAYEDTIAWRTPLWEFIRLLRGRPEIRDMTAVDALRCVEGHLDTLGLDWTRDFDCVSADDARTEFLDTWGKVRSRPGYGPIEYALDRAKAAPLTTSRGRQAPDFYAKYDKFISIAVYLQITVGQRPIILPCQRLAKEFRMSPMAISRWRRWAQEDGILKEVERHAFNPRGKGRATKFIVDVSQWPEVTAEARGTAA